MKEESEALQILLKNTKQKLFDVVYLILRRQKIPLSIALIMSLIQTAQLIYFSFQEKLLDIWGDDAYPKWVNYFLEFFTLMKYVEYQSYTLYLVVFYICVGLVQISVLLILGLSILKNSSNFTISITILRGLLFIIMTIGFEPILRILLGLLACKYNEQGQLMMTYVQNQECWEGLYIIHALISIITFVEYLILIFIFAQICIESKRADYNCLAQQQGQTQLYYYLFVFASLLAYSVLEKPKYSLIIILIQISFSFIHYNSLIVHQPFYNLLIQRVWVIMSSLNFWTQIMMLYSYFLEEYFITKAFVTWLIGIPFIIAIQFTKKIQEIDLITVCMKKSQNAYQIVQICNYILRLIQQQEIDSKAQMLLMGYIEFHRESCSKPDCVLLVNKNSKMKRSLQTNEKGQQLMLLINQLYLDGLAQYPQSVNLKISYSYFLLDFLKFKQQALNELQLAQSFNPSFDEQFFIFRYQTIIEQQIVKQQQKNVNNQKLDIITEKTIKVETKQLQYLIEESSMEFLYFWSQLQEDIPNLKLLHEYGNKILQSIEKVEKQWNKILDIDQYEFKLHRILSKYYEMIVHDEKQAYDLLSLMIQKKRFCKKDNEYYDDITNYGEPLILMSLQGGKVCTILNINKAAFSLLGFSKTDLINRSLEIILPSVYVEYNLQLIEFFLEEQQHEINAINIFPERLIMLKTKSNYIVSCYSQSQVLNSLNGFIMTSKLKQEVYYKPRCYIVIDIHGKIQNVSSSCISILKLDEHLLRSKEFNIQSIFPTILINKEDYIGNSNIIEFDYQFQGSINGSQDYEFQHLEELNQCQFQCTMSLIDTPYQQQNSDVYLIFGYIVKLDLIQDQSKLNQKKQFKKCDKIFKFFAQSKTYQLESIDLDATFNDSLQDRSIIWEEPQKLYLFSKHSNQSSKKQSQSKHSLFGYKHYYGNDIRTMRLIDNRIIEVEEQSEEYSEYTENEKIKDPKLIQENEIQEVEEKQINKNKKLQLFSRSEVIELLKNSKFPILMQRFNIIINFFILAQAILTLIFFIFINNNQSTIINALSQLTANNQMYGSFLKIQSNIQDLRFVNFQLLLFTQNDVGGQFEQINKLELSTEIKDLISYMNELENNNIQLKGKYKQYQDEYENLLINMKQISGQVESYTFEEAIQQMLSKSILLNSSNLSAFQDSNQDFFYYNYNLFNSILLHSRVSQNYYFYNIINLIENISNLSIYCFISQLGLLLIVYLLIFIFFNKYQYFVKEILSLFLEIDEQTIKRYIKTTQDFVGALRLMDDQQLNTLEDENDLEQDLLESKYQLKRKKKRLQFSTKDTKKTQVFVALIMAIYVVLMSYIFYSIDIVCTQTKELTPLLNLTSMMSTSYSLLDNALRETFWNESHKAYNLSGFDAVEIILNYVIEMDAESHSLHQKNYDILDIEYQQAFIQIYIMNPCIIYDGGENPESLCSLYNNGILLQGLSLGITKFLESIKYLVFTFNLYDPNQEYDLKYNLSNDKKLNFTWNILNTPICDKTRIFSKVYMKQLSTYLTEFLEDSLNTHFEVMKLQFISTCVSYFLYTFFLFFFWWIPSIQKNRQDLINDRTMLSFIPIQKIQQIELIKNYISKYQTEK